MKRRSAITALGVLLVALACAAPASAVYIGDGSKQDGTMDAFGKVTNWAITDYGACFKGIQADGVMVPNPAHNNSRPDCIDQTYTSATPGDYDTSAACLKTTGRSNGDIVSHYWTKTCVDGSGNGINLDGLDRTATNCALKGGTWQDACTNAWIYTGPAGDGAPGFCYTTVVLTTAFADSASCTAAGYTWASSKCTFAYGVAGYANAAIAKKDGSGNFAAAGAFVDVSGLTQGECLAAGASWSTGTTKSGTTTVNTTPDTDPDSVVATVTATRAGCLECHNSTSQYNTYAERWKEPYLNTGHKNMLRKVTAGKYWAGPDGEPYTTTGTNALDTYAATYSVPVAFCSDPTKLTQATCEAASKVWSDAGDRTLFYVFGDWMAPNPTAVYQNIDSDPLSTNGYSCAACHATGWSNVGAAGVCWPDSTKTTAATCLAPNVWVPASGVQGASYTPAEPAASFPGIKGITGKWDRDGIICSRCHATTFPAIAQPAYTTQALCEAAGFFWSTQNSTCSQTSTHNNTPSSTKAAVITNICFGCHQSPATTYAAATISGVTYPTANAKILDPVMIPTGANHGQSAGREFNGHVLGNMFLNSPHARYTGSMMPNALGKYDLATGICSVNPAQNTTVALCTTAGGTWTNASYNSTFKGMICRTSATLGGGSILATVWKGGAPELIKTKEDCNLANAQPAATNGYWQAESQGNCTTCHDVHQSLFDPTAEEPIRRECTTCHEDAAAAASGIPQVELAAIRHPFGLGTPLENMGTKPAEACEICHMPKPTAEGFPMHLWRVNVDPAYDTFPTTAQFNGTGVPKDRRARTATEATPAGAYAKAVWVDVDLACGQCHGGSLGSGATTHGAPYYDKAYLAYWAEGIHSAASTLLAPTPAATGLTVTNLLASFTDASTDNNGELQSSLAISVNWGDGTITTGAGGAVFSHTYTIPGTYTVIHKATDVGGRLASELLAVTVSSATSTAVRRNLVVTVVQPDGVTPIARATVYLKRETASGYVQVRYGYTNALGQLTFGKLLDGKNYRIVVYKSLYDFNGTVKGKQAQAKSDPILMSADRTLLVTRGAAATNGPAAYPWRGTDGGLTVFTPGP